MNFGSFGCKRFTSFDCSFVLFVIRKLSLFIFFCFETAFVTLLFTVKQKKQKLVLSSETLISFAHLSFSLSHLKSGINNLPFLKENQNWSRFSCSKKRERERTETN